MEYYNINLNHVFKELTSYKTGLTGNEANRRIDKFGKNELEVKKGDPWWKLLLSQFNSPVIWVLLGAVVVSIFVGEVVDAMVIGIILFINAVLGFVQEFKAEKSIEALQKMASPMAVVIRDGKETKIDATELVPGDIIILETGEKVPADCRLIECSNLNTQEAALTGESTPVIKYSKDLEGKHPIADQGNMVFAGTIVIKGRGKAIVCHTGMQTEMGKIAGMIKETEITQTPLQNQLSNLGKWLGILTLVICAVVFVQGLLSVDGSISTVVVLDIFMVAVALAVAAIPEGLPAVVTVALSLGVQRMVKKNALMRHLPSVETLGCTTVICSDKTGTLTRNEMTVKRLFVSGKDIKVVGSGYQLDSSGKDKIDVSNPDTKLLLQIGALNNDSELEEKDSKWSVIGDPTEGCLVTSAKKAGFDVDELRKKYPRTDEVPFDSVTKRMITVHKINGKSIVYVKGAVDLLLDDCTHVIKNGKPIRITSQIKKQIIFQNEKYAKEALRVLGFAYKELSANKSKKSYNKNFIFVGLQAMIDPPREEVKPAIVKCKTAGIKVIMITGDLKTTAEAIGKELGIEGKSMSGSEIDSLSDEQLTEVLKDVSIFARVNPKHKMRIVNALKNQGEVVAMTGDGVNDAPALKNADIGIAMGITGTDVAKEASEMILTDDNFNSIVNAVEEGRGIYDNIRKFVNYLLSCNVGEVLVIFIGSLMGLPLPLLAVHLLWINLVTDGLPAIALGVDPVAKDAMNRPPRKVKSRIMSKGMSMNVFSMGILIAIATLIVYWFGLPMGETTARTMAFTTLVMLEVVRIYMIRSSYHNKVFSNKWLIGAIGISLALQFAAIYSPLNSFLKTVPLGLIQWTYIAFGVAGVLLFGTVTTHLIKKFTHEMY